MRTAASRLDVLGRVDMAVSDFTPVFGGDLGDRFVLVSSPTILAAINLINDLGIPTTVVEWNSSEDRRDLIDLMREFRSEGIRASIMWIADTEFEHYLREDVQEIKLGAIPFFSNSFTTTELALYLDIIKNTDYRAESEIERQLIEVLEESSHLELETPDLGTHATFRHLEADFWFSLHGPLEWGDQTVLPTGELSSLADASGDFSDRSHFAIDGTIAFMGSPVVHRGDRSVTMADTEQMFDRLSPIQDVPVIAEVDNGFIVRFTAPVPEANGLRDTFNELLKAEPRYRKIHEFGFGTHKLCEQRLRKNFHPNERWPGIHLGLGLGGYTPFHLDLTMSLLDVYSVQSATERTSVYQKLGLR